MDGLRVRLLISSLLAFSLHTSFYFLKNRKQEAQLLDMQAPVVKICVRQKKFNEPELSFGGTLLELLLAETSMRYTVKHFILPNNLKLALEKKISSLYPLLCDCNSL